MQSFHVGRCQRLGPLEQGAGAWVDRSHLALLVVRHCENSQGENLVDFGRVEQIARTLGSHLWMIVKDDG